MIKKRDNCRGCNKTNLLKLIDLGKMPLAGGFLSIEEIQNIENGNKNELKIPLRVYYCQDCGLVQILDIVDPEILFKKYFYISSVIPALSEHFKEYSNFLKENYLNQKGRLLEFGCNDGVLLQYFHTNDNITVYGIDPSENIVDIARKRGFNVILGYFNSNSANKIKDEIGKFDVVTGSNVFAHTDDIREIIKAAKIVLKDTGVLIVEVHYLKDLLDKFQYDTIYHEHLCYYTVTSLKHIFELENMKIIDVHHLDMHGGAIRVVVTKEESNKIIQPSVVNFISNELDINIRKLMNFGITTIKHKRELIELLDKIKNENREKIKIIGYGAPGRGTILLNYCGIDNKYLDYIVDMSPLRANKFMPGVHIPIFGVEKARNEMKEGDYFLLLAWNYEKSILEQEKDLIKKGVKFIVPLPEIKIV